MRTYAWTDCSGFACFGRRPSARGREATRLHRRRLDDQGAGSELSRPLHLVRCEQLHRLRYYRSPQGEPSQHRHPRLVGADSHYTYQQYDDSGRGRTEPCYANSEKGLTCLGQAQTKDGLVQTRSYIWPTDTGLGIRQEKSVNAGPWSNVGRVDYVRRTP